MHRNAHGSLNTVVNLPLCPCTCLVCQSFHLHPQTPHPRILYKSISGLFSHCKIIAADLPVNLRL